MKKTFRELVKQRSGNRCEYCQMPQQGTPFVPFHVEHIIARQHVDQPDDDPKYLAYACDRCNAFKGPNLSSVDPDSRKIVLLFNPRQDMWDEHFLLCKGEIIGLTPTGRATVRLLNMNASRRVELRSILAELEEK